MLIVDSLIQSASFLIGLTYTFWATVFFVPLFITVKVLTFIRDFFNETFTKKNVVQFLHKLTIVKLVTGILGLIRRKVNRIISFEETRPFSRLLRQSRSQQQVMQTLSRAAANPLQITQNQKVIILMQKMQRLQQILYQESVDRRKAENQLFELRQKFQQKSSALVKQKSQCVENMNKINVLKLQLAQKTQNLQKSNKYVAQLEVEVKKMKQNIEKMIQEGKIKQKQDEKINSQNHQQKTSSVETQLKQQDGNKKQEQNQNKVNEEAQEQPQEKTQQNEIANENTQINAQQAQGQKISGQAQSTPVTQNENLKLYAEKKKKKKVLKK